MMSPSITDDRNAQLTTQLENLEKRLKAMEKRNRIVRWSLQHCATILESLQTKETHCLLATIHRLVLERSFYCGLVRKYAGTAANSVLLNPASHPGISLLLLSKSHSPRCFELYERFL
ncbi:hypothetical protein J4Q44_G00066840, partial [Coregonus suidteri]